MKWRSGFRNFAKVATIGISTMVFLYAAALLSLHLMGYDYAVVISDSMAPTARRGDLVLIKSEAPVVDDVILFKHGEALVLHRLKEKNTAGWATQGDANPVRDPWVVKPSEIVGVGVGVLKGFGAPLLMFGDSFPTPAQAYLNDSAQSQSLVSTSWWSVPQATWTMVVSNTGVTYQNPAMVNLQGNGVRKVYSATRFPTDVHLKGIITSTNFDSGSDWIRFIINGCTSYTNILTCGYAVTLDKSSLTLSLAGIKSNASFTTNLATCAITLKPASVQQFRFSIYKVANSIKVSANYKHCFTVTDLSQAAAAAGAAAATGGYTGIWIELSTRADLSPFVIW